MRAPRFDHGLGAARAPNESLRNRASWAAVLLAAVLLAVLAAGGCATNPVTGKRQFSLVSSEQELSIGRDGYQAVLKEYGRYDDARLQAYVDSVGQSLARVSQLPNLEWHFTLLDDPVVNAFAMPGGYIYITRGILAHLNSEAQLAGVLGHEIGHVTARHTASRITQQQIAGLGLGLASIFSESFRQYSNAAQTALGIIFLKYSRADENQADELGVGYAVKAGYDPREIPPTYAMLKRVSDRAGQKMPGFLSTHPDPGDREVRTEALATQAAAGKSGLVIRGRSYIDRLEGVVFGADPRDGTFEGSHFYHPGLGFEMRFPEGWKTQNSHSAVMAAEPSNRATMQLTLIDAGTFSPAGYVRELERSGKISGSRGGEERIGGDPAWVGVVAVTGSDNTQRTLAAAFIRRSDAQMFEVLGATAASGDENEDRILTAARSFRRLTDPARLSARPDRVHVVTAKQQESFDEMMSRLGIRGDEAETLAIVNNLQHDENILRGQQIKIVEHGMR